jgi:hypothetical protein
LPLLTSLLPLLTSLSCRCLALTQALLLIAHTPLALLSNHHSPLAIILLSHTSSLLCDPNNC